MSNMDIYENGEENQEGVEKEKVQIKEEDFLFDKAYECTVCGEKFKSKTVKANRAKLIGTDIDLRPRHQGIDTIKYDCITCNKCGYSALSRYFGQMTDTQAKLIRASITSQFKGIPESGATYTYEDAFLRYQLALVNAVVKKSRTSERAYVCLKMAWLLRGMSEEAAQQGNDKKQLVEKYKAEEAKYINNAYEGFKSALINEDYPICGMDRVTYTFLLAALGSKTGDYSNALKYLSEVIITKGVSERIKEKARELKEEILRKSKG